MDETKKAGRTQRCTLVSGCGPSRGSPPPAKVVEQFIEAHLQGQFAASRSFTLERVNLSGSLFSNWLFGPGGQVVIPPQQTCF